MNDEPTLRDLLHAGLRADEYRAPDFDTVWSSAAAQLHRTRTRSIFAKLSALAAAIAFAAIATFAFRAPRATAPVELPWRSAVLLTEWRAPTDAFLPAESFSLEH